MATHVKPRLRECPSCSSQFETTGVKCICPGCGAAFFAGANRYADAAESLVKPVPPPAIEDLPKRDRRLMHWLLAGIARSSEALHWYPLVECGWLGHAEHLIALGFLTHVPMKNEYGFAVTEKGIEKVRCLTAEFGEPLYPRAEQPQ